MTLTELAETLDNFMITSLGFDTIFKTEPIFYEVEASEDLEETEEEY